MLSWPIYELFNDGKLSALKNRSEQFLLLQQFFIPNSQSASLSPIGLIPASWNGTSHSTPHLSSIWHSPQIQEDRFVPQNFSSFTLLNHSFLCLQLSGNSKVPDRKGMTSNGISGPLQILGMGQLVQEFGKCAYLKQEYMQWPQPLCSLHPLSRVFSTLHYSHFGRSNILWRGGLTPTLYEVWQHPWPLPIQTQ